MSKNFLYCEDTDTKIYSNDVVSISTYGNNKWIAKSGWFKDGNAQKNGWYFISVADKTIIPAYQVDLKLITKEGKKSTSEYKLALKDMDSTPSEVNYIVIPGTNIRLYEGDIIVISNKPSVKWFVHSGWYIYDNVQNYGWYFESIKSGEILPSSAIDLTLCTLVTDKTQGSELYDGRVVNYTRPFTLADAELLNRTFITVETIKQRDNIDTDNLINGRMVRVNDVGGTVVYYSWNSEDSDWDKVEWGGGGSGIPQITGTQEHPIILSQIEKGLYRILGYYKITEDTALNRAKIDNLAFVSGTDDITIKVITETSIWDYVVSDGILSLYTEYTTKAYVDGEISVIERQLSELISELPEVIENIVSIMVEPIDEDFIRSLFD